MKQDLSGVMSQLFYLAYVDVYGEPEEDFLDPMVECYYNEGYWYYGENDVDGRTYFLKVYHTGLIEFFVEESVFNVQYLHINQYPLYKLLIEKGYEF